MESSQRKRLREERADRLEAIGDEYEDCLQVLADQANSACDTIWIRREFLTRATQAEPMPPMAALRSPRGHSLRLELILIFLAQNGLGRAFDLPVSNLKLPEPERDHLTWSSLLIGGPGGRRTDGAAPSPDAELASRVRRAGRSAHNAIADLMGPSQHKNDDRTKLQPYKLVITSPGRQQHNRISVVLADEKPQVGRPRKWTHPPKDDYQSLAIPDWFFTRGWIYVLTDNEIALYLMYRLECQGKTRQGLPPAAWLAPQVIGDRYGLPPSVTDNLWLLRCSGIVRVHRHWTRRTDGTVPWPDRPAKDAPAPKRDGLVSDEVIMTDGGLEQDARARLIGVLREGPSTAGLSLSFPGFSSSEIPS